MLSIIPNRRATDLDVVGYKLRKLAMAMDRQVDQRLQDKFGLTLSQFMIMLGAAHQSRASQCSVARFLNLTQAAVSRQIDGLVELNLISRTENDQNRREHILTLTEDGAEMVASAKAEISQLYQGLLKSVSLSELKTFAKVVDTLQNQVCHNLSPKGE